MTALFAFSVSEQVKEYGAIAGFAAILGLGLLSLLYFAQAREIKRLRDWAGRAPERAAELDARVAADAQRRITAQPIAQRPAGPAARPAAPGQPASARPPGAPVPAASPGNGAPQPAAVPVAAGPGAQPAPATGAATQAQPGSQQRAPAQPAPGDQQQPTTGDQQQPATGDQQQPATGDQQQQPATGDEKPAQAGAGEAPKPAPATAAAAAGPAAAAAATPGSGTAPPAPPPAPAAKPQTPAPAGVNPPALPRPQPAAPLRVPASQATLPPRTPAAAARRPAERPEPTRSRARTAVLAIVAALAAIAIIVVVISALSGGGPSKKPAPNSIGAPPSGTHHATASGQAPPRSTVAVTVVNGTTTNGLARSVAGKLAADGWPTPSTTTDRTNQSHAATAVFYARRADRPAADSVARALGLPGIPVTRLDANTKVIADGAGGPAPKVVVVLGADYPQQSQ